MELKRTQINITIKTKGGTQKKYEFDFVHNLSQIGYSVDLLFVEWRSKTKNLTTDSFCRFALLKDSENVVCMKYQNQ